MCQVNTDPMTAQIAHLAVMVPPDIDNTRTSGELGLKSQWGRKVHLVKVKVNFIDPWFWYFPNDLLSGDITAREHSDTAQLECAANGVPQVQHMFPPFLVYKQTKLQKRLFPTIWNEWYVKRIFELWSPRIYSLVPQPKIIWKREGGLKIRTRNAQHQHRLVEAVNSNRLEIHKVGISDHDGDYFGLFLGAAGGHGRLSLHRKQQRSTGRL